MHPLNQKFHNTFSQEELEGIIQHATAISYDVIVIATHSHFFELSANRGEALEIYSDTHSNNGSILTKEAFLELYLSSPMLDSVALDMDA